MSAIINIDHSVHALTDVIADECWHGSLRALRRCLTARPAPRHPRALPTARRVREVIYGVAAAAVFASGLLFLALLAAAFAVDAVARYRSGAGLP